MVNTNELRQGYEMIDHSRINVAGSSPAYKEAKLRHIYCQIAQRQSSRLLTGRLWVRIPLWQPMALCHRALGQTWVSSAKPLTSSAARSTCSARKGLWQADRWKTVCWQASLSSLSTNRRRREKKKSPLMRQTVDSLGSISFASTQHAVLCRNRNPAKNSTWPCSGCYTTKLATCSLRTIRRLVHGATSFSVESGSRKNRRG